MHTAYRDVWRERKDLKNRKRTQGEARNVEEVRNDSSVIRMTQMREESSIHHIEGDTQESSPPGGPILIPFEVGRRIEDLANDAFTRAKRLKKKLKGVDAALERLRKAEKEEKERIRPQTKKFWWFMRYRWLLEEDFLLIAGRSAEQNEELIKKHMRKTDLVFHTELPGSPFGLYRGTATTDLLQEAATFIATISRAWREGYTTLTVFMVKPEQVSKHARAGEYLSKGSFMIYGEKTFFSGEVKAYLHVILIGNDAYLMLSPREEHAFASIHQGSQDAPPIARTIMNHLAEAGIHVSMDEIIRVLPAGGMTLRILRSPRREQRKLRKEWL